MLSPYLLRLSEKAWHLGRAFLPSSKSKHTIDSLVCTDPEENVRSNIAVASAVFSDKILFDCLSTRSDAMLIINSIAIDVGKSKLFSVPRIPAHIEVEIEVEVKVEGEKSENRFNIFSFFFNNINSILQAFDSRILHRPSLPLPLPLPPSVPSGSYLIDLSNLLEVAKVITLTSLIIEIAFSVCKNNFKSAF